MPPVEPALPRAMEGLAARSGRTLIILGPAGSGKSALLARVRTEVEAGGGRIVSLRGSFRQRSVPFGALGGLDRPSEEGPDLDEEDGALAPEDAMAAPMAPVAMEPEAIPETRRRDGRVRGTVFGSVGRAPGPPARDAGEYWAQLLPEFRGEEAHPVAILLDDAGFVDAESRGFLAELSQRARLRPLLVAIALDSTATVASAWEELFLGRSDVDWVRLDRTSQDPREMHRLHELLEDLPPDSLRTLGYVTLLEGETSLVGLARTAKVSLRQLPELLRPLLERGLVKARETSVAVPDRSSVPILRSLLPESELPRWHLEVAEGLQALSPVPPLPRRIEIAQHYLGAAEDAVAMARLFESAEVSLDLLEFDGATRLLSEALRCLESVRPAERTAVEPEMHLVNARALFYAGCPTRAESELREGVEGALRGGTSATDLASWLEPLVPALVLVGPRRRLTTTLVELTERLHEAGLIEPEGLLEALMPGYDAERNLAARSHADALRAAQSAHRMREPHLQALGLFAMGVARSMGSTEEMVQAARFLKAARYLLRASRRWDLDYLAAEFECRSLEGRGRTDQALAVRQENVAALDRARLPSVELLHQLGIARIHLDRAAPSRADAPLDRAIHLADSLHLLPPSPGLLRAWLLEGRRYALAGSVAAARDRWSALADLPPGLSLPRFRAEALLRLALLEQSVGRTEEVARLAVELKAPGVTEALPGAWRAIPEELAARAPSSGRGGGPLPQARSPPSGKLERRERRRR